jgi:hypothetical protein
MLSHAGKSFLEMSPISLQIFLQQKKNKKQKQKIVKTPHQNRSKCHQKQKEPKIKHSKDDFTSPAEKISRTQNKDKLTHSQKLQAFFFINKKEKKQMKFAAIGGCKGQTLSYNFQRLKL